VFGIYLEPSVALIIFKPMFDCGQLNSAFVLIQDEEETIPLDD
jgi:hypothetical protein